MVHKFVSYVGFALVILVTLLQNGVTGMSDNDPSTIINVYPSLEAIRKSSSRSSSSSFSDSYDEGFDDDSSSDYSSDSSSDYSSDSSSDYSSDSSSDYSSDSSSDYSSDDYSSSDSDSESSDDSCKFSKKGSCASASNIKPTWLLKSRQKDVKTAQKEVKRVAKVGAAKHHNESKKSKVAGRGIFIKEEVKDIPVPAESKSNSMPNSDINTETSSHKVKKLHDHLDTQWSKVHNWSGVQDMLQLLKKRKH